MEDAPYLLQKAKEANLNVIGISFHVGSCCQDTKAYEKALNQTLEIFKKAANMQMNFKLVNIGGGFPGLAAQKPTLEEFAAEINTTLDTLFPDDKGKYHGQADHVEK
jgi:ornithine decarboxylase